ncbi:hypothetical protein J3R82DRAFT_8285 [Butyriboletus roseoflavus]|nr:hypothetical protein J3R82DRAFT_8285 [Butyriboletus roseoflavus]
MADYCNGAAGRQEVEVDKEALVKILARYPGTFDVLRELIQNADDAVARNIQIHFQTKEPAKSQPASQLDVSKLDIHKWIIKNDGNGFGEKDWKRLGKIAHGNDDSRKVGAFGVGFYSVLSKSDRPLVRSNGKSLQFYKREDGKLCKFPADCPMDSWTSIELELRKPEPLPMLTDLTRFLVSSVAFLTHIDTFVVHLDSERVLHVEKQAESPVGIPIPEHLKPTTPQEALTVESIQRTVQRITINTVESAFPPSSTSTLPPITAEDLVERCIEADRPKRLFRGVHGILKDNTIMHDLYTATINVNLGPESEMMRGVETNMKRLPSDFECKAVYFNSEQYESLVGIRNSDAPKAKHLARLLFGSQGIIPENDSGRLFIGQSTSQTTGIGLHISAHFLPTMERGSIDLANGQVAGVLYRHFKFFQDSEVLSSTAWNKDVLFVGGFLARVIYEQEMQMHATKSQGDLEKELGLCTMARFTFGLTVPHGEVSKILQEAFFSCCHGPKSPFPVVSDAGISCASDPQIRQRFRKNNRPPSFLKTYVVFHEDIEPCQRSEIIKRYNVPAFRFQDIVQEFKSGVTQDALKSFFVWWEDFNRNPPSSTPSTARDEFCQEFASQGILHTSHGIKIAFKDIEFFTFLPLPNDLSPPDTIHVDLTSGLRNKGAIECFGWTQLPLLHWLKYACSQAPHLASSEGSGQASDVGYRILRVLVQFALVEEFQQWDEAAELMKGLKCIPTNTELQLPANSYFEVADVCGILPVADYAEFDSIPPTPVAVERGFEYKPMERLHVGNVLLHIGVRVAMDWNDMIERYVNLVRVASGPRRLLRFLTTIRNGDLTVQEINDLQTRRVFYSENHGRAPGAELYLPNEDVRKLRLPIFVLSQEAMTALRRSVDPSNPCEVEKVIESLGIREYPTLDKIIALAASDELVVRPPALKYFLLNLEKHYNDYEPENFAEHAFIPTKCKSYARLNEVFDSPIWEKLGFKQPAEVLRRDLSRLGIKDKPSIDTIVECFKNPERRPSDIDTATIWFEYLHLYGKLPIPKLREQLSTIPFVPVKNLDPLSSESSPIKYICPKDCLITSNEMKRQHRDIFPFVSFGQHGNGFLDDCRAKKSPDASDIISKILENPRGYLKALQNNTEDVAADELLPAEQVPISDWAGRDFAGDVFVAYEDDTLKKMYREMGSEFLGTCVRHVVAIGGTAGCSPPFNHDEVIRRIGHFMDKRDKNERKDTSFCDAGSTNKLSVKGCNSLTLEQIFTPPNRVDAAATIRTKPVQKNAGFEFGETDGSYTLWMVSGIRDSRDLHYDIAVALCHVLLKTYVPDDVYLLASLFAANDELLERYYPRKTKRSSARDINVKSTKKSKAPKKEVKFPFPLPACLADLAQRAGVPITWSHQTINQQTTTPEGDMETAIRLCGKSDSNGQIPGQPDRKYTKKYDKHCKQAHTIKLKEKPNLRDRQTKIRFFLAQGVQCEQPLQPALEEFAKLIEDLANVFNKSASTACFIFWKDTDEDLMAFNRDQKCIFLNLAHYHKFCE